MQKKGRITVKKTLIFIVVLLLCFIPSAIAYGNYQKTQNAPVDEATAVKISIDDINGKNYTLVRERDGAEADKLIKYFLDLKKNATQIVALHDSLMGEKCYNVTLSTSVRDESYEFYFSPDPSTCYYRAHDGKTYKIAEDDAVEFIASEYAESLYSTSALPVLTLSNKHSVTPDTATWQYKNYTGGYAQAIVDDKVNNTVEFYEIEGGLDIRFDTMPDYCNVKITDDEGTELYNNPLSDMFMFSLTKTETLSIEITAKWYEDPSRSFSGELGYKFTSMVTAPAEFYIGMQSVESGKFVAITATNVTHPENIRVSSDIKGTADIKFYKAEDNMAIGLFPIDVDTPSGMYTVTFSYAGTTQESTLTVENGGEKVSTYTVPEAVISLYHTKSAIEQFTKAATDIMSKSEETRYFSGHFLQGVGGTSTLLRGFGRDVYLNGASTAAYRNNGIDYRAVEGTDVIAWNAGKVVYSGMLDYSGYIVVIDHGIGLKTWYYNMGSCTVNVGDTVARGDKIGTCGKTGFTGEVGVHVAMSVGKTFVSPYDTWADSSVAGKVIIPKIDE